MTKFVKDGYFENGIFVKGLHPSMIGKKIIHVGRCLCPWGYDGSFSTISGKGYPQDPQGQYVTLHNINADGSIQIEWNPRIFRGKIDRLESYWNDGNWIEYIEESTSQNNNSAIDVEDE
jgi:hypothetical protein